jgi:large subunit ribosomal protein L25
MFDFILNAEPRTTQGKGASRRLRRTSKVPGIIYGAGEAAQSLTFDHNELIRHLEHEAFYSHVLTVKTSGGEQRAVLKDVQRHPARAQILHLDLLRVSDKTRIRMRVPLHFTGADAAPGVKTGGGVVSHLASDIEIECFPKDLPEYIAVDCSQMNLGDSVHLSQLKPAEGVALVELTHGHDHAVVSLHKPRVAEEPAPAAAAAPAEAAKPAAKPAPKAGS